jgi:hypothetical protein
MTPDDVISLRRSWRSYPFEPDLPESTVLATADWLTYVLTMAAEIPPASHIVVPSEEEARWAWPDGVTVVFDRPVEFEHVILSHKVNTGPSVRDAPHFERQAVAAFAIGPPDPVPVRDEGGVEVHARRTWCIGVDPGDFVNGFHAFAHVARSPAGLDRIDFTARFRVALITALGHRLTTIGEPTFGYRAEQRRVERALPDFRVLRLSYAEAADRNAESSSVEWSKRWIVRGHWRSQPHGPQNQLRRLQWIDTFVKGPADKPLDVRATFWKTMA